MMVMLAIVLIGVSLSVAARQWKTMVQRELEADLLAKGIEIQNALAIYSATMKAGRVVPGEIYPAALIDLTKPPRPFLRKVYLDPIGHGEWEIIRSPNGGVMGVRSKSRDKPIKQREFPLAVRHFEGRSTYYDWAFQFPNLSTANAAQPGAVPGVPGVPGQPTAPAGTPGPLASPEATSVAPQPEQLSP